MIADHWSVIILLKYTLRFKCVFYYWMFIDTAMLGKSSHNWLDSIQADNT